jgi:hypothetical protein
MSIARHRRARSWVRAGHHPSRLRTLRRVDTGGGDCDVQRSDQTRADGLPIARLAISAAAAYRACRGPDALSVTALRRDVCMAPIVAVGAVETDVAAL